MRIEDINAVIEFTSNRAFVAYLDGLPGVNTQGDKMEDAGLYLARALNLLKSKTENKGLKIHPIQLCKGNRGTFMQELIEGGCKLIGHDEWHVVVANALDTQYSTVPKQAELRRLLMDGVCTDLGITFYEDASDS